MIPIVSQPIKKAFKEGLKYLKIYVAILKQEDLLLRISPRITKAPLIIEKGFCDLKPPIAELGLVFPFPRRVVTNSGAVSACIICDSSFNACGIADSICRSSKAWS